MRRRLLLAVLALLALGALTAPVASAECDRIRYEPRYVPDPFGTTGGQVVRVPVCISDGTPVTKPKPQRSKPKPPTRAQLRALRFRPTAAVSAKVEARLVEQLAVGEQAEAARAQIESGDLMRQFDAAARQQGWSPTDLGDVYTFAYLQFWFVVNARTSTTAAVDKAVREDLRRQLALDRKVGGASDAVQQENAEWLASWLVVINGTRNQLRTLGDPARVEAFRERARELIAAPDLLGVDLSTIRLTQRGIARR